MNNIVVAFFSVQFFITTMDSCPNSYDACGCFVGFCVYFSRARGLEMKKILDRNSSACTVLHNQHLYTTFMELLITYIYILYYIHSQTLFSEHVFSDMWHVGVPRIDFISISCFPYIYLSVSLSLSLSLLFIICKEKQLKLKSFWDVILYGPCCIESQVCCKTFVFKKEKKKRIKHSIWFLCVPCCQCICFWRQKNWCYVE